MTVYDKVNFIVDYEMNEIKKFSKKDLLLTVKDLTERLLLEMTSETIDTYYKELKNYE